MARDRLVPLVGGHNCRDFGGYPTDDGRQVRRGVLFRSGLMTKVDRGDVVRLRALGIVTICDLRTAAERRQQPTTWPEDIGGIVADDAAQSPATLRALLGNDAATADDVRRAMTEMYRDLPFQLAPVLRCLFRRLVAGHVPLLVNCSAGKDRTGVAAAIVLRALGVARASIEEDFLLTNAVLDVPRLLADSGIDRLATGRVAARAMMSVEPDYLTAAFDSIDARHGRFADYRAAVLQVNDAALAHMRDLLLHDRPLTT